MVGLGTGSWPPTWGFQNLTIIGGDGPDELAYVPADAAVVAYANVRDVMDSEVRRKLIGAPARAPTADQFKEQTGINSRPTSIPSWRSDSRQRRPEGQGRLSCWPAAGSTRCGFEGFAREQAGASRTTRVKRCSFTTR